MRVAILWPRFGAYHLARLRGAAEVGAATGARIFGIEIAQRDEYAWNHHGGADGFERITVFADQDYGAIPASHMRRSVASTLDRIQADVVAINGWAMPEARAAIFWRRGRPQATAILMSETKEDDGIRKWWKEMAKRWLVRQCDAALVGGAPQGQYLKRLGFPGDRVFKGYDVVDVDYFIREAAKVRADAAQTRARLGLPQRYFFACTRFLPRKNIAGLLRAYAAYRLAEANPWALVIAGSGEDEASLRQLAGELSLDGVTWPGFVQYDVLPAYFALADAFVHPAVSEPWGLVVNEAAACALPLLVSRTVGAGYELVEEGQNGYLFDPRGTEDMQRVLTAVSALSPAALSALGARSAAIARDWGPRRFGEGLFSAIAAARAA